MEDVLDVYHRPYDHRCPQVCMDETSKQLVGETRTPLPRQDDRPALTTSMSATACATCSSSWSRYGGGGMCA
jgi:hypothetical protein